MARRQAELLPLDVLPEAPRAEAALRRPLFGDDAALLRLMIGVGVAATLLKIVYAAVGNVVWEEAHFAVLGQHPAWGYADVPAGWPLFARLSTSLFGWSPFTLRLCGIVTAQALPFAVYFLTRAVGSRREALWAALLSMLIPALTAPGTIFYPEGALQTLTALMLGCAIRAVRTDRLGWWALTGVAGAAGLFIHYRFVLVGMGVVLFTLLSRDGRRLWARPGLYVTGAVAVLGLLPGLLYNATSGWPSLIYHVSNRPDANRGLHLEQALHFLQLQAELATPVLLVALIAAGWAALKRERDGEQGLSLLFWTGAAIFGTYLLLSPVNRQIMPHWPFMAYVAWLPLVPRVLSRFADRARSGPDRALRSGLIALGPVLTVFAALGGLLFQLGWAHPERVPERLRPLLVTRLEDWRQVEPALARARATAIGRFGPGEPALAASGHISALRLEFPGRPGRKVYALDEPYDEFSRFNVMRAAWGLNEAALSRAHAGGGAVLVLPEPDYLYHTAGESDFRRRLCAAFDDLSPAERIDMPPGRTAVEIYTGRVRAQPSRSPDFAACPLFPRLYLAQPQRGGVIRRGRQGASYGLATDPKGIASVQLVLDGRATQARYGIDPPGARAPEVLRFDPNYPGLHFDARLPEAQLTPGAHRLSVRATTTDGRVLQGPDRTIYVH